MDAAATPGARPAQTERTGAPARPADAHGFYIPSLDGIRAVAFLIVFVAHAGLDHVVPGGFGVTVFFFLSGYLITTLLRMEYDRGAAIDLRGFYVRRTLRIFPPYYVVLAVAAATTVPWELDPAALWAQFLYLGNYAIVVRDSYDGIPAGTGVYWSLAVEEHFYLFFPLLYLVLRRRLRSRREQLLVLGGLCALVLAWRCVLVYGMGVSELRTYLATDARIDSILFGCMLAVYGNPMLDAPARRERALLRAGVPAGLALLVFTFVYRDPAFRETFRYTLQGLALFPLFVLVIRHPELPLVRWLNLRAVRQLGVLSYGTYLVHQIVLARLSDTGLPPLAQGAAGLALSVAAAMAVREAVEKPSAMLRRRVLQRVRQVPVASA